MDAQFETLRHQIDITFDGMQSREWQLGPEAKWNIAQIAEHLSRAYGGTAKLLEIALASDQHPEITPATFRQHIGHLLVLLVGYFPNGVKSPEQVRPQGLDGEEALRRIRENIERMDAALREAEKRWGRGALASHPMLGPMTAKDWRKFHLLHGLHHLRQVRQRRLASREL